MSWKPAHVHVTFVALCAASAAVLVWVDALGRGISLATITALVAVSIAAVHLRTRAKGNIAWWLAFVAFCFFTVSGSLWLIFVDIGGAANPPQPLALIIRTVGYLFLLGAALIVISPTARRDFGGVLDAATIGVGGALALWVAVLDPALERIDAADHVRLYTLFVTLILSALTGALLRVAASPTAARPAVRYFLVAVTLTLMGNVLGVTAADPVTGVAPLWVAGIWPFGYAAAWAAAVHPASHAISAGPLRPVDAELSRRRSALLGVALSTGPLVGGIVEITGTEVNWLIVAFAQLLLVSMVLVRIAQISSALRTSTAQLELLADHDPLTGLANRRAVDRHLESLVARVRAQESPGVVVVFVDLDGFKPINDSYGHGVGDELLAAIAARLAGSVRQHEGDLAGRIGGDEFVLVVEGEPSAIGESTFERAQGAFSLPFELTSGPIAISASVGLWSASSGELTSVDELLTNADAQMYQHKRRHSDSSETEST